jgi:very-short-patch-repair endonuclease
MAPINPEAPISSKTAELLARSLENWKRKLLDLTKRNRALNFRATRVSTVTIVDEHPAEVFRQLYLRERSMRFKAAPEVDESQAGAETAPDGTELMEESDAQEVDFVPYDTSSLDERYTDDWLQTSSTPEALDKSLRRLDEQARLSIEEQGVNMLFLALGMLHYTEATDSSQIFKAPLLLLPVELTRKSARSGYALRATDDDPLVNPSLVEYLRRDYGIAFPELPDWSVVMEDYDLQSFFKPASDAIASHKNWAIKTDIYLSLFSFQKFVMYKDLEANHSAAQQHRLVRQLVTRENSEGILGLPDEIRALDLDRDYPPETTFLVVDADASQLRVIAAASRNYDLVIEGPPGTGKSQTITNLIAQALASGKSVLFVAEKMAALQVVHSRLAKVGLSEFCLELHSTKANKREVMKQIASALDASLQQIAAPTLSTQRLPPARKSLAEYVDSLHSPFGALALSPYRAYGELGSVLAAPRWVYNGPPAEAVTREQLDETVRELKELSAVAAGIGIPARHPWRDTSKTFYSPHDLEVVQEIGEELAWNLSEVIRRAELVRTGLQLPPIRTFSDIEAAEAIATVIARSPGAPLSILASESWNAPPPEALALIERCREIHRLTEFVGERFTPAALDQEHAGDIAYVERKAEGIFSFLAFLDSRYRSIKKRWLTYRLPSYQGSVAAQANDMKHVDRLRRERSELANLESTGRALFGALWKGEDSSGDLLESYVSWVVEFRSLCVRNSLTGRALERAASPAPDVTEVRQLSEAAVGARRILASFSTAVGWPEDLFAGVPVSEIAERVNSIQQNLTLGPQWAAFEAARQSAGRGLACDLLPKGMSGEIPFGELAPSFQRAFYLHWLSKVVHSRPALERFNTLTHEERVAEFSRLDEQVLKENRAALIGQLRDQTQHRLREPGPAAGLPHLRREMARQRGLSPLRRTFRNAGAAIRAIKPCFMMSPLTVAQYVEGMEPSFDLVIFDEASQLPPEDSVGAILRGRQLIVVGDSKQLPPTNFFMSTFAEIVPQEEDGTPLYEDSESILEGLSGAGLHQSRLKWHYRSLHESLIHFSNVSFYDTELYTFPSIETLKGLQFNYVADGIYEGKGLNLVEVRRVVDEIVRFALEQLEHRMDGQRMQSLGVGTFNLRQQLAIQDELEQRRRANPEIEPFFDRALGEPFFVKNLENIQGDERDVIFLSVTYGRGPDGKLRYNFGPLNGQNGWRRLNVLTTRARHHMQVFSSIRGDEIGVTVTGSAGARLLREFLLYAERGSFESMEINAAADTESTFERDVFLELSRRGVRLVPQVGVSKYRIDFGVLDDDRPGRFLCGIECDGAAYHASETARDRDRLRRQVLESRGWTLYRVWSTDWFKDRAGQIERLLRLIEEARARARAEADEEQQAREIAAAQAAQASEANEMARWEAAAAADKTYERPVAPPYTFTPGEGRYAGRDILEAPISQLVSTIADIVAHEGPIHSTDLFSRVAGMWSSRVGSRIQARIQEACDSAERGGIIERKVDFFWSPTGACRFRSRSGTRIPANRIAPEEYREAILTILETGFGFSRQQLIQEVRSVFGFSRTGPLLDESIGAVIDDLVISKTLGEGSSGIRLRDDQPVEDAPDSSPGTVASGLSGEDPLHPKRQAGSQALQEGGSTPHPGGNSSPTTS